MAAEHTTEGTLAPGEAHAEGGLPQMNVETFASQIFWLVLTFTFLMVVLARFATPNIRGAMEDRAGKIQGDLKSAEDLHRQAADSQASYEAALGAAKARAHALADENRKKVTGEIDALKAEAEAISQSAMAEAEGLIAESRRTAGAHIRTSAVAAAAEIVHRLIGEQISEADAAKALEAGS
jgi:F-type H+-transporting ATPase subunit b